MVGRDPLIGRLDGIDQLGNGRAAVLQRQQHLGREQSRVGATLAAARSHSLMEAAALCGLLDQPQQERLQGIDFRQQLVVDLDASPLRPDPVMASTSPTLA